MGKNQSASNLTNIIQYNNGNIAFVSGSTTLMSISSSGAITTTGVISGSNALSASYAATSTSASYAASATSASYAISATTSSFANAFTVAGTLTAQTLVVQTITSSVDYVTGSTRFGSSESNTHVFTGSVNITGSLAVSGGNFQISDNSGSFSGFSFNTTTGLTQTNNNKFTLQGALRVNSTAGEVSYISGSNVGIGTTSPSAQLHINTGGSYTNTDPNNRLIIERNNHAYILFSSPIEYDNGLHFHNTTDNTLVGRIAYFHRATGDSLTFSVDSSIRMTINSSGNVLIGGTVVQNSAANRGNLTINGTTSILNLSTSDTNAGYLYHNATDMLLVNAKNGATLFYTNDTERMRITSGGNVGIGTTPPSTHMLQINNPSQNYVRVNMTNTATGTAAGDGLIFQQEISNSIIKNQENGYLAFGVNGSETNLVIAQNGKVGIGIASPDTKLHVYDGTNPLSIKLQRTSVPVFFSDVQTAGTTAGAVWSHNIENTSNGSFTWSGLNNVSYAGSAIMLNSDTGQSYITLHTAAGANTAPTERMRIVGAGSVGIGVTPKTYASTWTGFQVGNLALMGPNPSSDPNGILGANSYRAADNTWKRIVAGYANLIEFNQGSGDIRTYTGGTSTADSTISFVNGPFISNGGVSWTNGSSDVRKKKNFETTQGLAEVLQIEPIKYHFNWEEDDKPKRLGFKAQNLQTLIPEMVIATGEIAEDGSDYLTVTPDYILPVLVKAIQELKAENDTLKEILQRNNIQ